MESGCVKRLECGPSTTADPVVRLPHGRSEVCSAIDPNIATTRIKGNFESMTVSTKPLPSAQRTSDVDARRQRIGRGTAREKKSAFGQFMTPGRIATFMASLLPQVAGRDATLLDAGAGIGSLTAAVLERQLNGDFSAETLKVTAVELDDVLIPHLDETLRGYSAADPRITHEIIEGDFLRAAAALIEDNERRYTHVILNPPYKKISSQSEDRLRLRSFGIETVNLYSGFVGVSLLLTATGGTLCAIIPRSFCNGPYYRPFRDFILENAALERVHVFGSRSQAFADDDVLQENVIIVLKRGAAQSDVLLSSSSDASFGDLSTWSLPADAIMKPGDPQRMIHLPTEKEALGVLPKAFDQSLNDIGLQVSTGPVVDFRMRAHLRDAPEEGAVPLLYPVHFVEGRLVWPREGIKKPNAIIDNPETRRWLFPRGTYVIVRRFSSKEERRRVVATLLREQDISTPFVGFENHVNVFHVGKRGLDEQVAAGLTVYLNSTLVDLHFRTFSGHTQVNATDLKTLPYPSVGMLMEMGRGVPEQQPTQAEIDRRLQGFT